jgi:asparagine synthase (glutamine-hydrolysing)
MLGNSLRFFLPPLLQKEKIIELFKEGSTLKHPYFWLRALFTAEQKNHLLNGYSFKSADKQLDLGSLDIINQLSYLEMTNYMRDILLRDTDSMSMSHSLEVRVPLLDHKLVEFMFSVPGRFKMGGLINKPLLVRSLERPLPEAIFKRRKMGFTLPFQFWLKQSLKEEVEVTLRARNGILQEFINEEEVFKLWQGFLKGHYSWQRPWAIYVLKSWVKLYLQ